MPNFLPASLTTLDPKKWLNMELIRNRLRTKKSAMLNQPTRKSAYQFVYCGSVGAICRTQNNRGSIFSQLGRDPARQAKNHRPFTSPRYIFCPFYVVTRPITFHTWVLLGISFTGWQVHEMYNASLQFAITASFVLVSRYAVINL
jgi:hypothetical protein